MASMTNLVSRHKTLILKALLLAFGLGLSIRFFGQWWDIAAHGKMPCSECKVDFLSMYTGARLVGSDRGNLYNFEEQKSLQLLLQPDQGNWILPFINPPLTAVFLLPLGWFSFQYAYVLMTLINLALLAASCVMLIRGLGLSNDAAQWLALFVIANVGIHVALVQGQTSLLLLFSLCGTFVAWRQGHERRAGAWLALSTLKPQTPAALLTLLSFPLRRAFLTSVLFCLALVAALSVAVVGYDGTRDFLHALRQTASGGVAAINAERMHNLRALSLYMLPEGWIYLWVGMTVALVLVVWARQRSRARDNSLFLVGLAMILVSPHLFIHDLSLLVIPAACLLSRSRAVGPRDAYILIIIAVLPFVALSANGVLPITPLGLLTVFLIVHQADRKVPSIYLTQR
jgi:hypothetical protein